MKKRDRINEVSFRRTLSTDLENWSDYSSEHDYLEVTAWANGLGVDIQIYQENVGMVNLSLDHGVIDAIRYLTKRMKRIPGVNVIMDDDDVSCFVSCFEEE